MSVSQRTRRGALAVFLYLAIMAVFLVSVVAIATAQMDPTNYNSGLYAGITIWVFGVPAFFLGLILFAMLDWGLKKLWKKRSLWGIIPIAIALAIPVSWEYLWDGTQDNDFFLPTIGTIVLLLSSIVVVGLQLWLERHQEEKEKPKHGE